VYHCDNLCTGSLCTLIAIFILISVHFFIISQMGSRRFAAFIIYSSFISTIFELIVFNIFFDIDRYSGPYPQLGAVLALYHKFTPRLHPKFFGVLGYDFSEKSMIYGLCAQVILSGGLSTIIPTFVGFLSGLLCVNLSETELPEFVYTMGLVVGKAFVDECKFSCCVILCFLVWHHPHPVFTADAAPPIMMSRTVQRGAERANRPRGAPTGGARAPAPAAPRPPPPPPEEAIVQLTSMGFERQAVVRALQQTDNNIEAAANRLMG